MQKILSVLLALMLVLGLAACGNDAQNTSSEPIVSSAPDSDGTTTMVGTTTTTTTQKDRSTTSRRQNALTTEQTTETTRKPTTAATTMSREQYLNQEKITIVGSAADPKGWVYRLGKNGVAVRETTIDSGKGGDPVEIVQITDIHFNMILDEDLNGEFGDVIQAMKGYRTHMANGAARVNAERCLQYASYFDQTVITGDSIDFLTVGAIEMVKDVIWAKDPNALVTLGNHDSVRTWSFKGSVADTSTRESRYQILQDNWKHDIFYTSKVIGNKAMVIQMENGALTFYPEQISKLKEDIAKAKQNGYAVLLFFHVPLGTGKAEDSSHKPIRVTDGKTDKLNATDLNLRDATTLEMYNLITNNADVIKGIFTGHLHNDHYTEVKAKTSDGKDAVIPQIVLTGAFYDKGTVHKITVK